MTPNTYAQRLLNPFRGVMNIIEYQGAEAVTTDGAHWDIYVRDTELVADISDAHRVQTSDIRYGSWSRDAGLKRGALYPSDDFKLLEDRGATVYEYLLQHDRDIPFPLTDSIELWLLDGEHQPLGLIDSVCDEQDIDNDRRIDWRAGRECARKFRPSAAPPLLAGEQPDAGAYLTGCIATRAGDNPGAQWFRRRADGSGTGLTGVNIDAALHGRTLNATRFPRYFLREHDSDPAHRRLIEDFLAWQAPYLLLLQDLDDRDRRRFERLAQSRALAVERNFRLYPELLDAEAVAAARVEAALRRSASQDTESDDTLATYYIELNMSRTN
jgi:hypothetical protein